MKIRLEGIPPPSIPRRAPPLLTSMAEWTRIVGFRKWYVLMFTSLLAQEMNLRRKDARLIWGLLRHRATSIYIMEAKCYALNKIKWSKLPCRCLLGAVSKGRTWCPYCQFILVLPEITFSQCCKTAPGMLLHSFASHATCPTILANVITLAT